MKVQRICFTLKEVDTAIWVEGKKVSTQVGGETTLLKSYIAVFAK